MSLEEFTRGNSYRKSSFYFFSLETRQSAVILILNTQMSRLKDQEQEDQDILLLEDIYCKKKLYCFQKI